MNKKQIGNILMIIGLISIPFVSYTIVADAGLLQTNPPTPIGVAGTITYQNNTLVKQPLTVFVENTNTEETVNYTTTSGKYAIGISARTDDTLKIYTFCQGQKASTSIKVDMDKQTHWANLTLGQTETLFPSWLLSFIPASFISIGAIVRYGDKIKF